MLLKGPADRKQPERTTSRSKRHERPKLSQIEPGHVLCRAGVSNPPVPYFAGLTAPLQAAATVVVEKEALTTAISGDCGQWTYRRCVSLKNTHRNVLRCHSGELYRQQLLGRDAPLRKGGDEAVRYASHRPRF